MSCKLKNLVLLLAVMLVPGGRALASSTASITVNGIEQSGDSNVLTVSFNGFVESVHYGQFSTQASVASAFGAMFSRDYLNAGLCAHASGNVISFLLQGAATFETLDVKGSTTSFQLVSSGFTTQTTQIFDIGTVTLTVGGVVAASTNYGEGATPSTIAEGLAAGTTPGSFVNVTPVNDAVYLQAKQQGAGTNYSYTIQATSWDSTDFPQPSFVPGGLSGSLSGGVNAGPGQGQQTIYSYSIPSYIQGSQPTGYDADGNVVGYTDSIMGVWGFGYDTLNRLQSSSVTSGAYAGLQINWGYDAFGNRTSENFSGSSSALVPTSSTTSYNVYNQISSSSLGVVQTDGAGDVTSDTQNQYVYDAEGRICEARSLIAGNTMTGYIYGADGTRVSTGSVSTWGSCDTTVNGYQAMKDSILGPSDGQLTETDMDTNGEMAWSHTNVWVGSQLVATYDPNGLHFYVSDWVGSRRVQTDYQGVVEKSCTNLPYGDGETCSTYPSEELFAGLGRDSESELDHAMYRQYSSVFGRWTTPDPYGGSASLFDTQTLNRYAYVSGSPLTMNDRSGLDPLLGLCFGACVASAAPDASLFLSNLIGALAPIGFALDIFDLGKDFGLWDTGPQFHGNVAASQSGKIVPNAPSNGRNCSAGSASAGQYVAASAQVAAMTAQFFSGLGGANQTFGPGTATSAVMGQSAGAQEVLGAYYMTGQTSGLYTFGASGAYVAGGNPVAQFVGSFRWSISGGVLSLTNTTSLRSLTYDHGPQYQRGSFPTPGGNTHQTYQIGVTCR